MRMMSVNVRGMIMAARVSPFTASQDVCFRKTDMAQRTEETIIPPRKTPAAICKIISTGVLIAHFLFEGKR